MVKDCKALAAGKGTHFYAMKVQKSAEHYTEAAMDEVELLDCIAQKRKHESTLLANGHIDEENVTSEEMVEYAKYLAFLHDSFFHTGPNGRHMCMVFSMLGVNLLSVIKAFNYRGIPIEVVKKMIQGVCKGLDFLHRRCKIIHTDLKPENVLLQFPEQFDDFDEPTSGIASLSLDVDDKTPAAVGETIEQLELALQNPNLPADERKRIKKKLKRKRAKEKKRAAGNAASNDDAEDDEEDTDNMEESDDEDETPDEEGEKKATSMASPTTPLFSAFTDLTMEKIINNASAMIASPFGGETSEGATESHNRVKRRLNHSPFVLCNFGPQLSETDAKLVQIMRDSVQVSQVSAEELKESVSENEKIGGVAEVQFLLRAFGAEEALADAITMAFGGLKWETDNREDVERSW